MKEYIRFFKKIDRRSWLVILIGTISWSLTMVKNGLVYSYGMGFWGPNGHDGVWHIALTQSLAKGSWQMPIFAGSALQNYHLGFDLILVALHKLTFIPIHTLYFQIIPPILALGIGLSVYWFVLAWRKSKQAAFWSTFFTYFGGSFGWLITLLRDGKINGESLFWSQQSISTLLNPPFALSILLMFVALYVLIVGVRYKSKKRLMIASFLFGILVQIKVYAGILSLIGLLVAGIVQMMKRKGTSLIKVFTGALIISVLIFSPLTQDVGKSVIFKPFWFLEGMMLYLDRLNWPKFGEAMINYKLGGIWIKAILAYFIAFIIFWYGNFGTRFLFEIYVAKGLLSWKRFSWLELFLFSIIFTGILIPTFFIQSGTSWNTIQFFYYSLVFSGVLAGVYLGEFLEKLKPKVSDSTMFIIKAAVVALTIPTTIGALWYHYLPSRPPAKISNGELQALKFLSEQPDGIVLTLPFDKKKADEAVSNPPRPLYLYESTAYVSAFSGKAVFLEDEVNLEITGYDWRKRRNEIEGFLLTPSPDEARKFLKENNISYLYWVKSLLGPISEGQRLVKEVFENNEVQIFKFNN